MIDCKPFVETLHGKPAAVLGLGKSGIATVKALIKAGGEVIAWDDNPAARKQAEDAGAIVKELNADTLSKCACLIPAPGVPLIFPKPHPAIAIANEWDMEILGDLEILHRCNHGRKTIGITGTNGKSTTTALTAHILKEAGIDVAMGGNIGTAVLDLKMPKKDGVFVLEISSYQMDLCPTFRPDISVLLNITPDHLDRHGNFKNYAAAKEKIFEGEGLAVIALDDQTCCKIYDHLTSGQTGKRRIRPFSAEGRVEEGVFVENGILHDARHGRFDRMGTLNGFTALRGSHNHQNAAAAFTVCASKDIGLAPEDIFTHMQTFPGLPHRQFQTRVINGVAYINDSKATNIEAATKALSSYNNIYWIAGGRPKGDSLDDIQNYVGNIAQAFLIGEAAIAFAGFLEQYSIPYLMCGELDDAVHAAHDLAQAERGKPGGAGVVLLSPACASFDQFKSFEERGDTFTALVEALPENEEAAA